LIYSKMSTPYQKFMKERMTQIRREQPDLPNMEYMKMVAMEWKKMKSEPKPVKNEQTKKSEPSDSGSDSDSPTSLQELVRNHIHQIKQNYPSISCKDYIEMVEDEWGDSRFQSNTKSSEESSEDVPRKRKEPVSSDESSEDSPKPIPSNPKESNSSANRKPLTGYQQFMQDNMKRIRREKPELSNLQCMQLVAAEWSRMRQNDETTVNNESPNPRNTNNEESRESDSSSESSAEPPNPAPAGKKRYFKSIDANGNTTGRFAGMTPKQAASKAFTKLVQKNKQSGEEVPENATIYLRESTRGSPQKTFGYTASRQRLAEPMTIQIMDPVSGERKEITYHYKNQIQKITHANP
jgi:hypothetical protein